MSLQYDMYLEEHRANVAKAFEWIKDNLRDEVYSKVDAEWLTQFAHDDSKYVPMEYDAYDAYFYGNNKSFKVVEDFKVAWLEHIHNNEHHWQHWVLINDDPDEGTVALPMPNKYIVEMICDWWSFSHKSGDLYEIFDWYDKHKEHMILNAGTRKIVEDILSKIKTKLDSMN